MAIRTRALGGFNSPIYRRKGLAGLGEEASFPMRDDQIEQFLSRHPGTRSTVQEFLNQVAEFGYVQGGMVPGHPGGILAGPQAYAIPAYGISVGDSAFGNVVIFPGADGTLFFTAGVRDTIARQTNLPPFISQPAPSGLDFEAWQTLLKYGPYILGIGGALWLFSLLPRRRG